MSDLSRARRASKPASKAKSSLAQLAELRRTGAKRVHDFELTEEDAVYDEVQEQDYAKLVQDRREEAGDFIVDDDGMGYADIGEEEDWGRSDQKGAKETDDHLASKKRKDGSTADQRGSKRKSVEPDLKAKQRMQGMFKRAPARAVQRTSATDQSSEDLLSDILGSIGGDDKSAQPSSSNMGGAMARSSTVARPKAPTATTKAATKKTFSRARAATNFALMNEPEVPQYDLPENPDEMLEAMHHKAAHAVPDAMEEDDSGRAVPDSDQHIMPHAQQQQQQQEQPEAMREEPVKPMMRSVRLQDDVQGVAQGTPKALASTLLQHQQQQQGGITPTAEGSTQAKPPSKTPWKTPPPLFADPKTPATAAPASGWQDMYDDQADEDASGAEAQPEAVWTDDGSLPLDSQGQLPFFLLDAHEETATPGTVYLFGKIHASHLFQVGDVRMCWGHLMAIALPARSSRLLQSLLADDCVYVDVDRATTILCEEYGYLAILGNLSEVLHQGSQVSACAIVRGTQRNLFVVPSSGTFADEDLKSLQEEADADPSTKGQLMKKLHELTTEVKAELRAVLQHCGITQFKIRPVRRNYAFEQPGVAHAEQWVLKVTYPAAMPQLPLGLSGENFVAIFGSNQSALETVLLKRRVMMPCWLSLKHPTRIDTSAQVSWCKLEVEVTTPKSVMMASAEGQPQEVPPLVVAALNLKTRFNAQANVNEIMAGSVVYMGQVPVDRPCTSWNNSRHLRHFSVLRKMDNQPFPTGFEQAVKDSNQSELGRRNGGNMLSVQASERALLCYLIGRLNSLDPDVLVGHNVSAFDLDILLHRLQHHKVPNWSRVGRLKRSKFPSLGGGGHTFGGGAGAGVMTVLAGRLLCDTYLSARELVKEVDYTLATLSRNLLSQERQELAAADVPGRYESSDKLMSLVKHAESDAWLSLGLCFYLNVLPLTRQLSNLSGSLWSKALQGQRAQRIEMLLLHEFHEQKFMLPDKLSIKERERLAKANRGGEDGADSSEKPAGGGKKRGAPQYAGGLVLEPKKGLYDKFVLLLDFNSLYPSIIQEYNICFTTISQPEDGTLPALPTTAGGAADLALLPKVIRQLVQRRRQVKDMMKNERDPVRRQQLDVRQQALKLTANSMYGCLGFANSRFYAKPLAELITAQGREILQSTVDMVEQSVGLEVIYGDTDSIMINTNSTALEEVMRVGGEVKRQVNKRYRMLEIEIDGIFKCMLLLKKKKYAAVKLERTRDGQTAEVQEQKGLDMVRRDWCPLSKDVGNFALREILSAKPKEDVVAAIHDHLNKVQEKVKAGLVPLNKYIITKQLTKRPEDYPDAKNQAHVQVALRRRAAGKRDGVMQGETVPYIICVEKDSEGNVSAAQKGLAERAHHPEEINAASSLAIDAEYYLTQQVHPVVSRLCAPIEGTDAAHLADCLGLDPAKFRQQVMASSSDAREEAQLAAASVFDDDDRYKDCQPLWLKTQDGSAFKFVGAAELVKGTVSADAAFVPPDALGRADIQPLTSAQLANQVRLRAREFISQYYDGWAKSDDELLPVETRNVSLRTLTEGKPGTAPPSAAQQGHMARMYTETDLYTQLAHFARLLDADQAARHLDKEVDRQAALEKIAPVRAALAAGLQAIKKLQDANAYRWVSLQSLYDVKPQAG